MNKVQGEADKQNTTLKSIMTACYHLCPFHVQLLACKVLVDMVMDFIADQFLPI